MFRVFGRPFGSHFGQPFGQPSGSSAVAPPGAPTNPTYTGISGGIVLTQTPTGTADTVAGATSYTVQYDNVGTFASPTTVSGLGSPSYTFPSQTPGVTLYSRWFAVNAGGSSAASATASAKIPLVYDTFTDPDGTLVTAHTPNIRPSGAVWLDFGATVSPTANSGKILSNHWQSINDVNGNAIDTGVVDVQVTADWTPAVASLNRNSIVVRGAASGDYWAFLVREDNGDLLIFESVSGTGSIRATISFSWTEGTTYALKVTVSGSTITVFVNGTQQGTFTMTTGLSNTKVGLLRHTGSSNSAFDNFVASALGN